MSNFSVLCWAACAKCSQPSKHYYRSEVLPLLLLLLFGKKIAIRVGNALEVYPGAVIEGVLDVLLLIGTALEHCTLQGRGVRTLLRYLDLILTYVLC